MKIRIILEKQEKNKYYIVNSIHYMTINYEVKLHGKYIIKS